MSQSPYSTIRHQQISSFPGVFSGSEDALFCVVSSSALSAQAHEALVASAQRLGYHVKQLAFITLNASQASTEEDPSSCAVTPQDLLSVLEALDPLAVVLTDHQTSEMASSAYNIPLTLEQREFLLGHGCCCFESFEELLSTPQSKQRAWTCLKTLPNLA